MTAIEAIAQCVDKSKGAGVTVPRAELEKVVALARIGEAYKDADICLAIGGNCGECPLAKACEHESDYKSIQWEEKLDESKRHLRSTPRPV